MQLIREKFLFFFLADNKRCKKISSFCILFFPFFCFSVASTEISDHSPNSLSPQEIIQFEEMAPKIPTVLDFTFLNSKNKSTL
jgi:hypothetical protein